MRVLIVEMQGSENAWRRWPSVTRRPMRTQAQIVASSCATNATRAKACTDLDLGLSKGRRASRGSSRVRACEKQNDNRDGQEQCEKEVDIECAHSRVEPRPHVEGVIEQSECRRHEQIHDTSPGAL